MTLSRNSVDVFVVGGGPAGLAAAIAARQKGFTVAVADGSDPPVDKACGEGMMPETIEALRALGVKLEGREGSRFRGIRFLQNGSRASAEFPQGLGLGLRRPILHEKLISRALECGVDLLWKTPVSALEGSSVLAGGTKISARWIVGADGLGSRVRKWSNLEPTRLDAQRYATRRHYHVKSWTDYMEVYWGPRTQAYVTAVGPDEVCVVMIARRGEDAAFDRAVDTLPELKEHLRGGVSGSRERGAVTISRSLKNVSRGNVALLGDASGSVDAITGEGLRLGFQQALALADAMVAGNLDLYERAHRALEYRPLMMGRLMLLLAGRPSLRKRVISSFAKKPKLFASFLEFHIGRATSADLVATGAELGWQLFTS